GLDMLGPHKTDGHLVITFLFLLSRFDVNFLCGGDRKNEIAFHFNPRFEEGRDRVIFNSLLNKEWGHVEESSTSPFRKGTSFLLQFVITENGYKVRDVSREEPLRWGLETIPHLDWGREIGGRMQIEIFKDSSCTFPETK
uniref:Galectin n=1 Tax=Chrysemys picta bellii TaxID=8478 RepID=A0A8C3P9Q6_CHRPI